MRILPSSFFPSFLGASLLLSPTAASMQGGIRWEEDFQEALERARCEKKPVFIALNMEGIRGSEEAVKGHYKDPVIASLSRRTVNLFASPDDHGRKCLLPGLPCEAHRAIEAQVRSSFLGGRERTAWPQHLFLDPEGKILISAPNRITAGELEWMFVEALRRQDPSSKARLTGRARAPGRLRLEKAGGGLPFDPPPSLEEVEATARELRKGRGGFEQWGRKFELLVRSPEREAIKAGKSLLWTRRMGSRRKISMLELIARFSTRDWFETVVPFVHNRDDGIRKAAIITMAQLVHPRSASHLRQQWKKEAEGAIQGRLLRALAVVSPGNPSTVKLVTRHVKPEHPEALRIQATVATGSLEDRGAVTTTLARALVDPSPLVRSTAALVIAERRDEVLLPHLRILLPKEKDPEVRAWFQAAVQVVEGGGLEAFAGFRGAVLGDKKEGGAKRKAGRKRGGKKKGL